MYPYTDTQFNLMRIYLNLLMNIVVKEKGTLIFQKVHNTVPDTILVEKDFWFNPVCTF